MVLWISEVIWRSLLSKQWQMIFKQGIKGKARQGALSISVIVVAPQVLLLCVSYTCNKVYTHWAYFYIKIHRTSKSGRGKHVPESADSPQHSVRGSEQPSSPRWHIEFAMQKALVFMEMFSWAFHWMHRPPVSNLPASPHGRQPHLSHPLASPSISAIHCPYRALGCPEAGRRGAEYGHL